MKKLIIVLIILIPSICFSADHYVREGATGLADGTDWTNAWTDLPTTLTRGDTYYLADGSYGAYIFDDAVSGSLVITIKKATGTSHGTDTGWDSNYGDGQAIFTAADPGFTGVLNFRAAYYTLDGVTGGGPSSWISGHGIQVTASGTLTSAKLVYMTNDGGTYDVHHIYFKHIEFKHRGEHFPITADDVIYVAFGSTAVGTTDNVHDIRIQYCWLHNSQRTLILSGRGYNWLVEYSYFADNHSYNQQCDADGFCDDGVTTCSPVGSTSTDCADFEQHSEAWASYGERHVIVRYNKFVDIIGTGNIAWKENYEDSLSDWGIYGNIFFRRDSTSEDKDLGNGCIANTSLPVASTATATAMYIYNNTFYNLTGENAGVNFAVNGTYTDINVYNNVWKDSVHVGFLGVTDNDYNMYISTDIAPGSTLGGNSATSTQTLFLSTSSEDFSLIQKTDVKGKTLIGYDEDILGVNRNTDGWWDVGAYEYTHNKAYTGSKALIPFYK